MRNSRTETKSDVAERYYSDPFGYARDVLGITLTPDQKDLLELLLVPPYRVYGRAGHGVGKSKSAAVAISWLYDTRDPGMCLSTAPSLPQVRDVIWRELHEIRRNASLGGFKTEASLRMQSSPMHFAVGMTSRDTYSFQGKHLPKNYIIIEEATGVEDEFFEAADSMLMGEEYGLLCIYNPLSTATKVYIEEKSGRNHVKVMSCLNHPNIEMELMGQKPLYPSAVRLEWVMGCLKKWCEVIGEEDVTEHDFKFPSDEQWVFMPKRMRAMVPQAWYKPSAMFDMRVRGLWPRAGDNTIWSESLWHKCRNNHKPILSHYKTAIGCDVARFGTDMTEIFVRIGPCVVHHEAHNGWSTAQTCGRLKSLALQYCHSQDKKQVRIYVDEPNMGAGIIDYADGFNFIAVSPSESPTSESKKELYYNVRAQLWFDAAQIAEDNLMDLTRLDREQAAELERQLMAQTFDYKATTGQKYLHDKDVIKKEIKRSPDGADALNLTFWMTKHVERTSRMN